MLFAEITSREALYSHVLYFHYLSSADIILNEIVSQRTLLYLYVMDLRAKPDLSSFYSASHLFIECAVYSHFGCIQQAPEPRKYEQ